MGGGGVGGGGVGGGGEGGGGVGGGGVGGGGVGGGGEGDIHPLHRRMSWTSRRRSVIAAIASEQVGDADAATSPSMQKAAKDLSSRPRILMAGAFFWGETLSRFFVSRFLGSGGCAWKSSIFRLWGRG